MQGQKFGNWLVINRTLNSPTGATRYLCQCQCGCNTERAVLGWQLRTGKSKGCGKHSNGMHQQGSANPRWKGGKHITKKGYVMLHIDSTIGRLKAKLEHIEIMEKMLGRPIIKGETVHHKNGIKHDNAPTNLELRVSNHGSGQNVDDIVEWATEMLRRYAPKRLIDN